MLAGSACALRHLNGGGDENAGRRGSRDATPATPLPSGSASPDATPAPTLKPIPEDQLDTANDVLDYARLCKQELGMPAEVQAPYNCLDGKEVPVTIEGSPLDASNYAKLSAGRVGCDKPSWLGDPPCANYAFVQKRQITPDVEAMLLCRMRGFGRFESKDARRQILEATPNAANFRSYFEFDSLGLIWTNRKTGKTCFFDVVTKAYGGRVASPDDKNFPELSDLPDPKPPRELSAGTAGEALWKRNARGIWKRPADVVLADNCVRCHDTGAYKGSPWIEQVLDVPANPPDVPYTVVGKVFDPWKTRFPLFAISTTPVTLSSGATEPQVCTSCHRIGSQATCTAQLAYSVGLEFSNTPTTTHGALFAERTWMPPGSTDEAQWKAKYERHIAKLRCCCASPNARGCTRQSITTDPLIPATEGSGPDECR